MINKFTFWVFGNKYWIILGLALLIILFHTKVLAHNFTYTNYEGIVEESTGSWIMNTTYAYCCGKEDCFGLKAFPKTTEKGYEFTFYGKLWKVPYNSPKIVRQRTPELLQGGKGLFWVCFNMKTSPESSELEGGLYEYDEKGRLIPTEVRCLFTPPAGY